MNLLVIVKTIKYQETFEQKNYRNLVFWLNQSNNKEKNDNVPLT